MLQNSYLGYNNPGATEADIEAYTRAVVYGLFSVLATVGTVPVIRCAGGGPAEMVCRVYIFCRRHLGLSSILRHPA